MTRSINAPGQLGLSLPPPSSTPPQGDPQAMQGVAMSLSGLIADLGGNFPEPNSRLPRVLTRAYLRKQRHRKLQRAARKATRRGEGR